MEITMDAMETTKLVREDSDHGTEVVHNDELKTAKIDFLQDNVAEMTYGRWVALKLMDKPWYNPLSKENSDDDSSDEGSNTHTSTECNDTYHDFDDDIAYEKPNLAKAWAFFEHQSLYRYKIPEDSNEKPKTRIPKKIFHSLVGNNKKKYEKAKPGQKEYPSKLYPWWGLPHRELGDLSMGVGLYFSYLRALCIIALVCGLVSLSNILYFTSDEYDDGTFFVGNPLETYFLQRSAVCSSQEWVPCPDCKCRPDFDHGFGVFEESRCATVTNTDGTELIFALKNNCDGTKLRLAACNFGTVVVMILTTMLLGWYMKRERVKYDEDEQTAQDYSILVNNPPKDANDPEEWRAFFRDNFDGAQAVACTCAVDNNDFVKALVERRERIRRIHHSRPGHSLDMSDLAKHAAEIESSRSSFQRILAKVVPDVPEHHDRLVALSDIIKDESKVAHEVNRVFVTFDTEEDQRRVLENLSVGYSKAKNNDVDALSDTKYLFRKKFVLDVCEPPEPNSIRWQDLNVGWKTKVKQQTLTLVFTLVLLGIHLAIFYWVNILNPVLAGLTISIFNQVFPRLAKFLTVGVETHSSENEKQASLLCKIVLFRWVSVVGIFLAIVPFPDIISVNLGNSSLIPRVYNQFYGDVAFSNIMPLLDPIGNFKRHFLAPRAKTQESMNIYFQGSPYELAEKYANVSKILFLCLCYSSIFPSGFFLGVLSLLLTYYVEKFALLRHWKRAPALGHTVLDVSQKYILPLAVVTMAVLNSYFWTGFPYDNLCANDEGGSSVDPSYIGTFAVETNAENVPKSATVTSDDKDYRFCNMDFASHFIPQFPFAPSRGRNTIDPYLYMSEDQILSTTYFGWSAVGVLVLILFKFCLNWYRQYRRIFSGGYKAIGEPQGIPYSQVKPRSAYIPQVNSKYFPFPLIACNVHHVDDSWFALKPEKPLTYFDLTHDTEKLLGNENTMDPLAFSVFKTWTPEI